MEEKKYLSKEKIDEIVNKSNEEFRRKEMTKGKETKQDSLIPDWNTVVPPAEQGISIPNELKDLINTSFVITGFEVFPLKDKPGKEWAKVNVKDCSVTKFTDGDYRTSSEVIVKNMRKAEEIIKKTGVRVTLIQPTGKRYLTFA